MTRFEKDVGKCWAREDSSHGMHEDGEEEVQKASVDTMGGVRYRKDERQH
jgi:hypothetical protein